MESSLTPVLPLAPPTGVPPGVDDAPALPDARGDLPGGRGERDGRAHTFSSVRRELQQMLHFWL